MGRLRRPCSSHNAANSFTSSYKNVYLIQKSLLIKVWLCLTTHYQKYALLLYRRVWKGVHLQSLSFISSQVDPEVTDCSSGCLSLLSIWVFCAGGLQLKCGCHSKTALSSACPFQAVGQLLDAPVDVWRLHPLGFCATLMFLSCLYSTAVLSVTGLAKYMKCSLWSVLRYAGHLESETWGGQF